jgi:nucleoid-associated protein YgaU
VKREATILIAVALLVNSVPMSWAQTDQVSEDDLKTLLGDKSESVEVSEVSESAATPADAASPGAEASEAAIEAATSGTATDTAATDTATDTAETDELTSEPVSTDEPASTETVDIEDLETGDEKGSDTSTVEKSPLEASEASESLSSSGKGETPSDDLQSLKSDLGDDQESSGSTLEPTETESKTTDTGTEAEKEKKKTEEPAVFDIGKEERDLLSLANNIQGQISDNEWNEVATAAKVDSYTVVQNDWLFKISKKVFGSGYFYPKIWSINSFITNPHFIEPGMVLSFTTGSGSIPPQVKLGEFSNTELNATPGSLGTTSADDLANFGEDAKPKWLEEKSDLSNQGVYFQYASEETMDDLNIAGAEALNREYENYEPPRSEFDVIVPSNYDKTGFDKNSKIYYSFKQGFYLSTFLSTNIVQDLGEITNGPDENIFFINGDTAYIKFDASVNALAGDKFSVYSTGGKILNKNSDREGYKYTIVGQIKLISKIKDKWRVEFIEVAGTPQRGDRITTYSPKLDRITTTYNSRLVEAAILGAFNPGQSILGFGDVVYLDRGRADGVEMGNVFEVYGFKDRLMQENITDQPTYKMGELTVITLTDNFATVIVSKTIRDFYPGDIAITKTKEVHLREQNAKKTAAQSKKELMGGKALEELDVELNLDNLNDDLLKQADKIQLTEDELSELERQEREKSVIKDSERDLKALERLENEIEHAETILNDAKLDEDKLLESENLNDVEKKQGGLDQDSLDEIEENMGKRYIDEDLNSKDNPYGLNEFDVEEVDELLNTEKKQN